MQNLEKCTSSQDLTQNYLNDLLNELLNIEQNLQEEKQQLAQWEEEKEFSILGVIELFTTEIRGYAFQIITNQLEPNHQEIVTKLKKLNLLNLSYFQQWYFSDELNFSLLKNYVEKLNYLRLLILEYLIEK